MNSQKAVEELIEFSKISLSEVTGDSYEDYYVESDLKNELKEYLSSNLNLKSIEYSLAKNVCYEFDPDDDYPSVYEEVAKKIRLLKKKVTGSKILKKKTFVKKVTETVSDDMSELSVRILAKQITKTVQEPLVRVLTQTLQLEENNETKTKIAFFLNTEIGFGLLSLIGSLGVGALPLPGASKEILNRISKEMRLQGEQSIGDPLVEMVMIPLRDVLTKEIMALPIPGLIPQLPESVENKIKTQE